MDTRPLRQAPAFRRLWASNGLSAIGSRMTAFAVALQIYTLTHSSAAVGAVGLAMAVPTIAIGLIGGSVADVVDRRTLVLVTRSCLAGVSGMFAAQAFLGLDQLWLLYFLVAIQSLFNAAGAPAARTFLPRLLPADLVPAGAALRMFTGHLSMTAGPSLAGLIAAVWSLKACYLIDAVSFAASLYGVIRLPAMPPLGTIAKPGVRAVRDGLRFVRGNRVIAGALLADLSATVLGMPIALFPAINAQHFGGAAQTLGLITAAPSVGGLVGSALSGPVGRVLRPGRAMLIAATVWGGGLAGFGLAGSLWLALLLLAAAGAADVLSVVFRTGIVQVLAPDEYRGRVSAAEYIAGVGGPQLGNVRAGVIGSLTTPAISAVSGGLATIAGAGVIALTLPAFTRYQANAPR